MKSRDRNRSRNQSRCQNSHGASVAKHQNATIKGARWNEEGLELLLGKFSPGCGANAGQLHFVRREVYNPTKRTGPAVPDSRSVEKDNFESHESR
jgi:hypothetical protein